MEADAGGKTQMTRPGPAGNPLTAAPELECRCLPDGSWRQVVSEGCRIVMAAAPQPAGQDLAAAAGDGSPTRGSQRPVLLLAVRQDGYPGSAGLAAAAAGGSASGCGPALVQQLSEAELSARLRHCSRWV